MPYFKATIEILVDTPDEASACDLLSETLRDHLREFTPASDIIDWCYAFEGDFEADTGEGFEYAKPKTPRAILEAILASGDVTVCSEAGAMIEAALDLMP